MQSPKNLQRTLQRALEDHAEGRLESAERLYAALLAEKPEWNYVKGCLGTLKAQQGEFDLAISLLEQAVADDDAPSDQVLNLSRLYKIKGNHSSALARIDSLIKRQTVPWQSFSDAIKLLLQWGHPKIALDHIAYSLEDRDRVMSGAHLLVAHCHYALGEFNKAEFAYRQALGLEPDCQEASIGLASCLNSRGHSEDALILLRSLSEGRLNDKVFLNVLGDVLLDLGSLEDAVDAYRASIRLDETYLPPRINLGSAYFAKKQFEDAYRTCTDVSLVDPENHINLNNLASVLSEMGKYDAAEDVIGLCLKKHPEYPKAWVTLGNILMHQRKNEESIVAYRCAISKDSNNVGAHWNLSLALLRNENFKDGWKLYTYRRKLSEIGRERRYFNRSDWREAGFPKRSTVLIYSDQGLGDFIYFERLVSKLGAWDLNVILEVPDALCPLYPSSPCSRKVPVSGLTPDHDYVFPLSEVAALLNVDLNEHIAASSIAVPEYRRDKWRERLKSCSGSMVGIAWRGNSQHPNDHRRSIPVEKIRPLLGLERITFIPLNPDISNYEQEILSQHDNVMILSDILRDFADTAAVISHLDLVITVDTSVAHLSATMAQKTWILLARVPDYRWGWSHQTPPWYPTVTLIRQEQSIDWDEVIERTRRDLEDAVSTSSLRRFRTN